MAWVVRWCCAALWVWVTGACAPPAERAALIHDSLARDNRDLALRDPGEVAARFARMADDPFSFLRGSVGLWVRDVTTPGGPGAGATEFGAGVASGVMLVGDPHPENIGTARLEDGLLVGFNDFDVSRFGPAILDVRRLALATGVFVSQLGALTGRGDDGSLAESAVAAMADGYVAGMTGALGACIDVDAVLGDDAAWGAVVQRLLRAARRDGAARAEQALLTGASGRSRQTLDVVEVRPADPEAEVLLRLPAADAERLERALTNAGLVVHDVARVVGRGIGSRPLLRYIALVDDGRLVQVKEARDAFALPGYAAEHERFFGDNAARVVFARRVLLGFDGADALLRRIELSPLTAFTTSESGYLDRVRLKRVAEDLAEDKLTWEDVLVFAAFTGRTLAWAHRRGVDVDGAPIAVGLPAALDLEAEERQRAFVDEVLESARSALPVALTDHALLRDLLDIHGPVLGLPAGSQT